MKRQNKSGNYDTTPSHGCQAGTYGPRARRHAPDRAVPHRAFDGQPCAGRVTPVPKGPKHPPKPWHWLVALALGASCAPHASEGLRAVSLLDRLSEGKNPWRLVHWGVDPAFAVPQGSGEEIPSLTLPSPVSRGEALVAALAHGAASPSEGSVSVALRDARGRTIDECEVPLRRDLVVVLRARDPAATLQVRYPRASRPVPILGAALCALPETGSSSIPRAKDVMRWMASERRFDLGPAWEAVTFPMAWEGVTRTGLAITGHDTVRFTVPPSRSPQTLSFSVLSLRGPGVVHLQRRGRHGWVCLAEVPVEGTGWITRTVEIGSRRGEDTELRFTVRTHGAVVGLCEPVVTTPSDSPAARPNVLLIVHDTMRADRLGCYGYAARPTSTRLDSLLEARGFVRFDQAFSSSPWTLPAVSKLFASHYRDFHDSAGIPRDAVMLAEVLRRAGYYCAAYTGGAHLRATGLEQGFHEYHWSRDWGKVEDCLTPAREWLAAGPPEPFFLFVHTYETHTPYTRGLFCRGLPPGRLGDLCAGQELFPPELTTCTPLTEAERSYVEAAYDGGVRVACDATVELLGTLDRLGVWGRTLVVIVSDHGEEFWDHLPVGATHGHTLYNELIRVPLLLFVPGLSGKGVRGLDVAVSSIDVTPTVLELVGLDGGPMDGESLVPLLRGGTVRRRMPIFAQVSPGEEVVTDQVCVVSEGLKYIEARPSPGPHRKAEPCLRYPPGDELYDLTQDPRERRNLWGRDPDTDRRMREALALLRASALPPGTRTSAAPHLPDDLRRQLGALGYLSAD